MKKIISLLLACLMVFSLAGCGKDDGASDEKKRGEKGRIMYNEVDLSKAVKLSDYKNIIVDTSSKEFESVYNDVIASDIKNNQLQVKKTEGTVSEGDIANIDYVGKKNGVAFQGGTAQGQDLEIGSGSFIDGFEDGLIGAQIGKTVDLNLTFPANYHSAELAGQKVVFTVTVNSVMTSQGVGPEEIYEEMGYTSVENYEKSVRDIAIENYLYNEIIENSKVNDYPDKDAKYLQEQVIGMIEDQLDGYNMTLESYITQNGMTEDEFKKSVLENEVYPMMDEVMLLYAILDKEKIEITADAVDEKLEEIIAAGELKDYYGEFYFESMVARELAIKVVKENAKIK